MITRQLYTEASNVIYQSGTETVKISFWGGGGVLCKLKIVSNPDDNRQTKKIEKRKTSFTQDLNVYTTHGIACRDSIMMEYVPIRTKASYFFVAMLLAALFATKLSYFPLFKRSMSSLYVLYGNYFS